jgi:hypothetical protein
MKQFVSRLSQLKEDEKFALAQLLEGLRGRKCLIVESSLATLLGHITSETAKLFKEHGVYFFRELGKGGDFVSEPGRDLPDHIVYFIRPNIEESAFVGKEIAAAVRKGVRSQFHVYFVPSRSVVCEQIFEDEGAMTHTSFGEFNLGLVSIDSDIFTMEMSSVFRQCYLDGDTSSLSTIARALMKFQNSCGVFPNVKSKGSASKKVIQMLLHFRREEELLMPGEFE